MSQTQTMSTLNRLWCGVLVVTSVGCHAYSPYGYGGYPGNYNYPMYNQPGQVMPYGATGMPSGTSVMPVPETGGYPGGYPGGSMGPNPYNPPPGAVNPNGTYGPLPQGVDNSGDSLGTPGQFPGAGASRPPISGDRPNLPPDDADYLNQGGATPPRTRKPALSTVEPGGSDDFKSDDTTDAEKATQRLKKMETSQPAVPDAAMIGTEVEGAEFAQSATGNVAVAGQAGIVQMAQHVEAKHGSKELRPYGRAPNGRAWFRGLVDFDEQENAWYLIYNPEPDASDKQGGTITLVEHPHLKLFQPDDIILVEGRFDPSETDRYGNAKYRAEVVRRLVP